MVPNLSLCIYACSWSKCCLESMPAEQDQLPHGTIPAGIKPGPGSNGTARNHSNQFAAITRIKARSVLPNRVWHRKESCSMQSSRTTGATQPFWPPSPGDLSLTPTILSAPSRHASFPFDRRPPPRPSRRATSLPPHAGSLPPRPEAAAALTPAPPPPPPPPPSSPLSLPLYVLPKPLHAVERHLLPPI
ncbi:hypothetical protein PVAP13_9KG381058 [Panicum virgatum]|uniref:Uncharacterized protein n=1 Tax=Panicum virgatum TaxID=38727 RepID=A0A8T0N9G7_PANVG|nr:hypothetical protein PVAP13_9KG381058 [Panicum virgatum]